MFTIRHLSAGVSALFLCATTFAADLPRQELIEKGKRGAALILTESENRHWTAFCIDGSGLFLTSERAVALAGDPRRVSVVINAGEANQKTLLGRVVRADKNLDLALVRVEDAGKLSELEMGNSDSVVETSVATIFGFPTGKIRGDFASVSVKSGEVTSLVKSKGKLQYFVLEGAVTPSWAGAPALDSKGKVIGVVKYPSLPAPVEFGSILRMPSGGTGAGACTILPANDLVEWLAAPDIVFDPLPVSRERAGEPRDFHVRVVTWKKTKGELSLEFTVSTGKGDVRTYKGQLVEEGRFKVSAPLFPAEGSARRVPLTVRFEEGSVACSVKDLVFKVGEREVRLSELRRLEAAEAPDEKATVTLEDGDRIRGVVSGLKTVDAELGGATSQVNLGKALSITVEPQFAARVRSVDYKVVVKQDGKVANTVEGVVNILERRREREDEVVARGGGSELVFVDKATQGIVPHDELFNPGRGDFSVIAFFKSTEQPSDHAVIIHKSTVGPPTNNWYIDSRNNQSRFGLPNHKTDHIFSHPKAFDGRWHSVAMIREDGLVKCYFDGERIGSYRCDHSASSNSPIGFGALADGNQAQTLVGSLKNCSYWNRALSDREIESIALDRKTLRGDERGLVAYWLMDDGKGARFKDVVSGNHGTLKGNYRWRPDLAEDNDAPDGLVAHWKLDETRGGVVRDSGPHGLDGRLTEVDEPDDAWVKGALGNAVWLDGKKNYITVRGSEDVLNPGLRDWTISAWVKTSRTDGGNAQVVVGKVEKAGRGLVLGIAMTGYERRYPGRPFIEASGPSYGVVAFGETQVNDGQWHHLVAVREGDTLKIYVDGVLEGRKSDSSVGRDFSSDAPLQIGRQGLWDGWACPRFRGNIDDVRIYKRALSRREIEALADRK